MRFLSSLTVILFLAPLTLFAQAYRYQDEAGNLHFVDHLSEVPDRYKDQVITPTPAPTLTDREYKTILRMQEKAAAEQRIEQLEKQGLLPHKNRRKGQSLKSAHMPPPKDLVGAVRGDDASSVSNPTPKKIPQLEKVEIFVSPSCAHCVDLEQFLKENKIKFKKLDIVTSQKAFELFDQLGAGTKLPVTKVGAKVFKGLDYKGILEAATGVKIQKEEKPLGTL